ncbi:hypothetical protein IMSHALPRED_000788 [Imshaugia aleurites]|uniref:TRUD domain-containing protein n=1 Tax=Imshaugia aleurites TaxID=172621 RepID=A0A8H3PE13_9LECA|nr:hypothetical protein IMSHALPRED_000788 [Imshaugia aleurites]
MDEPELPASPRKKLRLQDSSSNAELTHADMEAAAIPGGIHHHHLANNTNDQFDKHFTTDSAEASTSSGNSTTLEPSKAAQISEPPIVMPESKAEASNDQSHVPSGVLDQKATSASDYQPATRDVADGSDNDYNKEIACGITEFVSPDLLGFSGILKKRYAFSTAIINTVFDIHRYTDFLVNEILPSGEVVHLDNLKAPPKPSKKTPPLKDTGEASSADATEHKSNAPPTTVQQDQHGPVSTNTSNDDNQTPPNPDTSKPEHPSFKLEKHASMTGAPQTIPQSMQGFDQHELASAPPVDDQEKISPHKRIPPQAPSIPLSMQDLDGKKAEPNQEKAPRRKEKVHIRQTSQGWVEFDKEKEDEIKKRKAEEDAAAGVQPEDVSKEEDINLEETAGVLEPKQLDSEQTPEASTQASWQAFASSAPNSSFQLPPEDKNTLLSYFSANVVDEILALYNRIVESPHRKTRDYGMVMSGVIDRQKRTTIHQDIRRIFDSRLETMTDSDGAMMVTAMAEKATFHARTPMNASTRNNDGGNYRGNNRGNGRVNNRGSDHVAGRGNDDRSRTQVFSGARGKPSWEDLGGKYLHFSLYKENKDTMEAISWLSKQVRMNPRSFQFAGTKDRRAVTVQRVSVDRVLVNAMISAGRTLRNAYIGNFEYRPHPLQLGELTGNEFLITLRDCDFHYPIPLESQVILEGAHAVVNEAMQNLSEKGFINYYGLQRFGTFSIGTEIVGLKMLQGDFQGAVDAILDYSPASLAAAQDPMSGNTDKVSMDDRARAHALHSYRTTNRSGQALRELPRRYSAESSIIRHLTGRADHRDDYLGALQTISRNLRLMYVHAYQSLVWNVAASRRWKRFGSSVIEGDLVLVDDHTNKIEGVTAAEDVDADGEAIVLPATDDRAHNPDDIFERARALTKEEAESGKYNIFDIVLPTPGYDILYPSNEIGKFYEEFMASERGGGLNPHDMRRQWKDISLSGSYRKILARPGKDLSFEIKTYKNEDEQFVTTDLDRLGLESRPQRNGYSRHDQDNHAHQDTAAGPFANTKQETEPAQEGDDSETKHDNKYAANGNGSGSLTKVNTASQESDDMEQGGVSLHGGAYRDYKIALIVKLQLGSSQYATMALRELMKAGGVKTYKADFSGGR